jgi:hypothetical protein
MILNPLKSPATFSGIAASLALSASGFAKSLWLTPTYFGSGPWHCTLWRVLGGLCFDIRNAERTPVALLSAVKPYGPALVQAAIIAALGGSFGRLLYWWIWERRREWPSGSET